MNFPSTTSSIRKLLFVAGIVAVVALACGLRFNDLGERPMHFDESVNARILADQVEKGEVHFDPTHYHGPLLSQLSSPVVRLRGETTWKSLTKAGLRITVASAGLLTVLLALLLGRRGARGDGLAAALMLATCPLLVYYSRMYIHETLFVLFGLTSLLALLSFLLHPGRLRAATLGLGLGLMAAVRETWVISLLVWGLASLAWFLQAHRKQSAKERLQSFWKTYGRFLPLTAGVGLLVIALSYTFLGQNPSGLIDFFRTYRVYEPVAGHEKPFMYFAEFLLWPRQRGGLWWTECGLFLLALYGVFRCTAGQPRIICRFVFLSGLLHLLIHSLIVYKTPWLACLGWMHIGLAAGLGAAQLVRTSKPAWRIPAAALVLVVVSWQTVQAHRAAFRFSSDVRNPYAYVPTSKNVQNLSHWLETLAAEHDEIRGTPLTVVGKAYWPLPWYLRSFDPVGYWPELPADAADRPLLILVQFGEAQDFSALESSHSFFPYGLRNEVLVFVALRNDLAP